MKRIKPRIINTSKGFTLIELLVVISIIAILAVIGISVYSGVQKQARDGVRRSEINSLGKSIETAKDPAAGVYTYAYANYIADYPINKPVDPAKASNKPNYCIATSIGTVAPIRPALPSLATDWADSATCPSNATTLAATAFVTAYSILIDSSDSSYKPQKDAATTATTGIATSVKYWAICAKMEGSGTYNCVQSSAP